MRPSTTPADLVSKSQLASPDPDMWLAGNNLYADRFRLARIGETEGHRLCRNAVCTTFETGEPADCASLHLLRQDDIERTAIVADPIGRTNKLGTRDPG